MGGNRVMQKIDNSNDLEWKEKVCPSVTSQGKLQKLKPCYASSLR